ncbi:hypothetical protein [Paenibacillus xylaniclasticus]|uniref:hypothetical protein n=1 Tax=Paenibacillus xylaniclasticus TaxID=588083 RepID=UPI0013DEC4D5|nr:MULTISPECIES: hypothetical protein [Paenibacillus]GFN32768.1 hypothetical protein PCURB6_30280 [Paenibacillus curdlanolyticus]
MRMSPGLVTLLLILSFLIGGMFMFEYYGYIMYAIIGVVLYIFIKCVGRHIVLLFMIPLLIVSLALVGPFFVLDFYNLDNLNPLNIHPFIFSWLIAFGLKFGEDFLNGKVVLDKIVVFSLIVFVAFFGVTIYLKGVSGISLFIHNYLGPITLFLFFYFEKNTILPKVNRVVAVTIGFSVLIGLFGILEYIMQANFLEDVYKQANVAWYDATSVEGYRIKTIIGHPLLNALYFLFAMILVQLRVRGLKLKYGLMLLFMVDILLTGSRSIFIFSFLIIMYNADTFRGGWIKIKQNMIRFALIGAVFLVTFLTSLGSTFLNRISEASSSTEARLILWDYFIHRMFSLQMMGLGGATENVVILADNNNPIILENPWIILFIDVGYFIVPYIMLLWFMLKNTTNKYLLLVFILAISGFNSFGVKSNVNYYLFILFAYGYILMQHKRAQDDTAKQQSHTEVLG